VASAAFLLYRSKMNSSLIDYVECIFLAIYFLDLSILWLNGSDYFLPFSYAYDFHSKWFSSSNNFLGLNFFLFPSVGDLYKEPSFLIPLFKDVYDGLSKIVILRFRGDSSSSLTSYLIYLMFIIGKGSWKLMPSSGPNSWRSGSACITIYMFLNVCFTIWSGKNFMISFSRTVARTFSEMSFCISYPQRNDSYIFYKSK
jgi:hypothetical protein